MRRASLIAAAGPIALAALATTAVHGPAHAFDCATARGAIETAICADPATKAADDAMSAAFTRLRQKLDPAQRTALLINQRRWLLSRTDAERAGIYGEDCTDDARHMSACLRGKDQERTRRLEATAEAGSGPPDPLVPVFVEAPKTRTTYDLGLFLYRFADPRTAAERTFDAAVDERIALAPRRRDADAVGDAYIYHEDASIAYASAKLLSVKIEIYYWGGGPHPDPGTESINIDMERGKTLALDDLVDKANRATIVERCKRQVAGSERDITDDHDGTDEWATTVESAVDRFDSWTFEASGATIALGRIYGYAGGPYECDLPYVDLRPLAKPGFPLPK